MVKAIATVVAFLSILAIAIILPLLFIKIGWSLFMVPVFKMAELSWTEALGFALLTAAFQNRTAGLKKDKQ